MLTIEIQGKNYKLSDNWSDITLNQFGELCKIPVPGKLKERWMAFIEDRDTPVDTYREIVKTYPAYYGKVIKLLSNVPDKVVDCVEWSVRDKLFSEYLLKFCISTVSSFPQYEAVGAKSFKLNGEEYFLPESLLHGGKDISMAKEKIVTFSEASDIEIALHEWGERGIEGMAQICAVYLRKEGEAHSDELVLQRTEQFKELPMSVIWEVFFLHSNAWITIRDRYQNIFKRGDAGVVTAARNSGIETFRVRGLIYEVALTGLLGKVKEVEQVNLWEFFDVLSYLRAQADFRYGLMK